MLLKWQRGGLEDAALGDSDSDEGPGGDNGNDETEEQYTSYVPNQSLRL